MCLSLSLSSDGETSNGEGAATPRTQANAITARPAGRGLTTGADATGWFQRGFTTNASAGSSPTKQRETPPRFSQMPTQPMEWTPTSTKDDGITGKAPPRHSQENTQPAPPQLTELYTQYRERHSQEAIQPLATNTDNPPQVMVTESLAQYQQTGECRVAHIIDAAQLTHPISSAENVDMQPNPTTPRPDTHDIAAPRRSIGGRCRKWVVSSQDPSLTNKRKCAACMTCSKQFTPGEPRLQQWGCRDTQQAYVHALCITGGLKTDLELLPKNPTDTEARDSVASLRDSTLSAAAAAEVVLPIHDPHEDNSTEAPDDDDRLFDREEALRHDDAIMDFHWFSTIPWTDIKDLRGATYVQPPTRFRFALQRAQHAILRAIIHHGPSSPNLEPAWKVLILSSWLLLGRPAENASDANRASCLETRLDLFWSEDWPALWALVRAECDGCGNSSNTLEDQGRTNRDSNPQDRHSC